MLKEHNISPLGAEVIKELCGTSDNIHVTNIVRVDAAGEYDTYKNCYVYQSHVTVQFEYEGHEYTVSYIDEMYD